MEPGISHMPHHAKAYPLPVLCLGIRTCHSLEIRDDYPISSINENAFALSQRLDKHLQWLRVDLRVFGTSWRTSETWNRGEYFLRHSCGTTTVDNTSDVVTIVDKDVIVMQIGIGKREWPSRKFRPNAGRCCPGENSACQLAFATCRWERLVCE